MENFNRFNPVFARTAFTFAGEDYHPGDAFEAPPHIVQRMWFARKLTHVKTDDLKIDDLKTGDPIVTLDHKGAGWYEVLMHGAVVSTEKIKGKQNAIDWAVNTLGVNANDIGV